MFLQLILTKIFQFSYDCFFDECEKNDNIVVKITASFKSLYTRYFFIENIKHIFFYALQQTGEAPRFSIWEDGTTQFSKLNYILPQNKFSKICYRWINKKSRQELRTKRSNCRSLQLPLGLLIYSFLLLFQKLKCVLR